MVFIIFYNCYWSLYLGNTFQLNKDDYIKITTVLMQTIAAVLASFILYYAHYENRRYATIIANDNRTVSAAIKESEE